MTTGKNETALRKNEKARKSRDAKAKRNYSHPDSSGPLDHPGPDYLAVLDLLHRSLQPRSYLEIGTHTGASFALARCPAISVDPDYHLTEMGDLSGRGATFLFQTTSDDFFARHDPLALLGSPLDLALLDGMHWFEFLLRDFTNTEVHCHARSLILMHDCLPVTIGMAARERPSPDGDPLYPDWWTGDVWKLLPVLKRYRPDLRISWLDCPPTALVAVAKLDRTNDTLRQHYYDIVAEQRDADLTPERLAELRDLFPRIDSRDLVARPDRVTSHFTLR